MKRLITFILALVLAVSCFAGCKKAPESVLTVNPDGLSLEENGIVYESLAQKAVVKTALAYLARGTRIQYEDTRFNDYGAPASATEYLYQYGVRLSPEEHTSQSTGYTNCGAFTYDVYRAALDHRVSPTAKELTEIKGKEKIYTYCPTGKETPEQMATVEQEFRSSLKMGDLIAIRYNGSRSGTGHVMLYVGAKVLEGVDGYKGTAAENTDENGTPLDAGYTYDIIHSTGGTYNFEKGTDRYEKQGTVQMMAVDALFTRGTSRSVFGQLESIAIVRPLESFDKEVPEVSKNRMLYMENIVAEKLSSHTAGMTVNPGDTITYTFSITNKRQQDVTLAVADKVAENTVYVSGAQTETGDTLGWTVTVPAGKTEEITYSVKVKDDAVIGDCVYAKDGTVGGVPVICPKVYIGRSLKAVEQTALLDAVKKLEISNLRGMELANALYNEVLDAKDLLSDDFASTLGGIFLTVGDYYYLSWENAYKDMVVPGLFGGRNVLKRDANVRINDQLQRQESNRTRLLYPHQLMVGDILIAEADAEGKAQKLYLYTGETMLNLLSTTKLAHVDSEECLQPILAYNRFAILRPSLMLDSKK